MALPLTVTLCLHGSYLSKHLPLISILSSFELMTLFVKMRVLAFLFLQCCFSLTLKEVQQRIDGAFRSEQHEIEQSRLAWVAHVLPALEAEIKAGGVSTCRDPKESDVTFRTAGFCNWWNSHVEGVSCTHVPPNICFRYSGDYHTKLSTTVK